MSARSRVNGEILEVAARYCDWLGHGTAGSARFGKGRVLSSNLV
ncbi:MAG: hypothetical protein AAFZ80_12990 [Cyanobacteria bacterium P01_A01_bin.105]